MHNIYIVIFVSIICIHLSIGSLISNQMLQSLDFINAELINQSVDYDDIYESGEHGYEALKINKEILKELVSKTLRENHPKIQYDLGYYFYDARFQSSCAVVGSICNSVQIKIIATYKNISIEKIKRFELIEKE